MARLEGLEPPTRGLENLRSIRLSYRRDSGTLKFAHVPYREIGNNRSLDASKLYAMKRHDSTPKQGHFPRRTTSAFNRLRE